MDTTLQTNLDQLLAPISIEEARGKLTNLAQQAGSTSAPQTTPSIDAGAIGTMQATVGEPPVMGISSSSALIQSLADVPSAVADTSDQDYVQKRILDLQESMIGKGAYEAKAFERAGGLDAEQQIRDINAEIARERASLKAGMVDEEGRVVPMGVITGRQAQMQKLSAARIEGLNAASEAAQGNLLSAQSAAERAVKIKYSGIEEEMAFRMQELEFAKERATNEEKKLIEQRETELAIKQAEIQQAQTLESANLALINQAVADGRITPAQAARFSQAILQGDSSVMSQVPAVAGVGTGAETPVIKTINGVDYQWNSATGQWETPSIGGSGSNDEVTKAKNQLDFLSTTSEDLLKVAKDTSGFKTPIGPSGITRKIGDWFIGDTTFRQAENMAQSLKTNILTLQTDPAIKKFFGPQMSEADVRMMSAGGTTLDPQSQSPEQFIAEVKRVDDMLNRALTAISVGQSNLQSPGTLITAPDGTLIQIID